jgi:hypothetical protein
MPPCFLNTSPVVSLPAVTDAAGNARATFEIRDAGDLNLQWLFVSPRVPWPLSVTTTRGLRVYVR